MTTLLQIDASARPGRSGTDPYGSHTRRLTARFVDHWMQLAPDSRLRYRDIGAMPPAPVTGAVEFDEFADQRLKDSIAQAEIPIDGLAKKLLSRSEILQNADDYSSADV